MIKKSKQKMEDLFLKSQPTEDDSIANWTLDDQGQPVDDFSSKSNISNDDVFDLLDFRT